MSEFLDIRTLAMVTGLISITLSASMVYFSMRRLTYPGFKSWTAGFVFAGLGMIFVSLRHQIPDWISILAANFCIFMFPLLMFCGLSRFKQAPCKLWLPWSIIGAGMFLMIYYTYWAPNVTARIVVVSLVLSYLLSLNVAALLKQGGLPQKYRNSMLTFVFAFMTIWYLFRAAMTPLVDAHITGFFSGGALQGISFIVYTLGCVLIMSGLTALNAQRMEGELASAGQSIEKLQELVPICSSCKKIRDDKGYWQAVESYIQQRTNDDLTHSICPECAKRLYPDLKIYDDDE